MQENTQKFITVGLGEILWDMLPDGKKLGGAPANFAYHAHFLGTQCYVVSCVGKDDLGREIFDCIDKLELNCDFIATDQEHLTGTVSIELDEQGKPNYIIHENVAWDFIPANDRLIEFASTVDAVCYGSLCQRSQVSQNTVRQFLNSTRPDCIRIFDINIRQHYYCRDVIDAMLKFSNVLKLNVEELSLVAKLLAIDGLESWMLKELINRYELKLIVLTKGSEGSILFDGDERSVMQAESIEIADTIGAGDSFTAAVAIGLLHKRPLRKIHENANRLASFVCSRPGATPKLPDCIIKKI